MDKKFEIAREIMYGCSIGREGERRAIEILGKFEKYIREDQRQIDAEIARKWLNQTDPCDIETFILNAGKSPEGEEKTNE